MATGQQSPALAGTPLEDVAPTPDYVEPGSNVGVRDNSVAPPAQAQPTGGPAAQQPEGAPRPSDVTGTLDQMPEAETPANPGAGLTPQQILHAKRLQAEHQSQYHPTSYQSLNPVDRQQFVSDMTQSAWGQGFMAEHGVSKDQFTQMIQGGDPSYSYVDAWRKGLIPKQAGDHWRDRADDGTWLKSPDHPTAWMEYYQSTTGRDPVEDGVDTRKWNQILFGQMAQKHVPDNLVGPLMAEAKARGLDPQKYLGALEAAVTHLKSPQGRQAFLGMGGGQPNQPAPKMRDGQPVGPDGYTDAEREYMRGAGVDPSQKPAAPAAGPAPAPPQQPAGLGTQKRQQQEDLERIQRGQDPLQGQKRSRLGGVGRLALGKKPPKIEETPDKRPRNPEGDEPGVLTASDHAGEGGTLEGSQAPRKPKGPVDETVEQPA